MTTNANQNNTLTQAIVIRVLAAPPAKDGGLSILGSNHPHAHLVKALREAMKIAMAGRLPFAKDIKVKLQMTVQRFRAKSDAINMINGVADVIQRGNTRYKFDLCVIEDDCQIREVQYTETAGPEDSYEVVIIPDDGHC